MSAAKKIAGLILIVAGALALINHQFSYTRQSHEARIGALELSIKNKETVDVPTWAGVAAIVAGTALLLAGNRSK